MAESRNLKSTNGITETSFYVHRPSPSFVSLHHFPRISRRLLRPRFAVAFPPILVLPPFYLSFPSSSSISSSSPSFLSSSSYFSSSSSSFNLSSFSPNFHSSPFFPQRTRKKFSPFHVSFLFFVTKKKFFFFLFFHICHHTIGLRV